MQDCHLLGRIEEIKKHMMSKIRQNSQKIISEIVSQRSIKMQQLMKKDVPIKILRKRRIEVFNEIEKLLEKLYKDDPKILDDYLGEIDIKKTRTYYRDFIVDFVYDEIEDKQLAEYLVQNTSEMVLRNRETFEDIAPIVYIHNKVYGTQFSTKLKHVIIDEAQDYGDFQFYVLKTILNSNSMTILGDLAQGVYSYRGIENWKDFINKQFSDTGASIIKLNKTYRTTAEIMEVANRVIQKLSEHEKEYIENAIPVIKSPGSLNILPASSCGKIVREIAEKIRKFRKSDNYKSMAIIGKDMKECKMIKNMLEQIVDPITLIESKEDNYNAGISIIPSYLAKGLEFDHVILINANNEMYKNNSLDIKLLYVAITRAMNRLDIYCLNAPTDLIK